MLKKLSFPLSIFLATAFLAAAFLANNALANGPAYLDIARDPASGLAFERAPSASWAQIEAMRQDSLTQPIDPAVVPFLPFRAAGQTGLAVLDADLDGDLDLYVTNGPGAANSLFMNQLVETGEATFVDVGEAAGVGAVDHTSGGVCYGDTDNDGDPDLLVLGLDEDNRFFENLGDGTFAERPASGLGGGQRSSPSCAMGDVNGDGLLDVVVANSYGNSSLVACFIEPWDFTQHNQLFLNGGGNTFEDVSASSGIQDLEGLFPDYDGGAGITWALSVLDLDLDGDQDIVFADDQCDIRPTIYGGSLNRGYLHVMLNDGTGHFTDHPFLDGIASVGSYMGLSFGDLDCDGNLDLFSSNFGDYENFVLGRDYIPGQEASRALFGRGDGTFEDRGVGSAGSSVFGWGNAMFDRDLDGDLDVVYHGGMDITFLVLASNPGVLLENQGCSGDMVVVEDAFTTDHARRTVHAVAAGDLDGDGKVDIASASNLDLPPEAPMVPIQVQYGAPLDDAAVFTPLFAPTPEGMVWTGTETLPGSLSVELDRRAGAHRSASVTALGSVGLTPGARANRSGIGAVVSFHPEGGHAVLLPVLGGSSMGSQSSLEQIFGLGEASHGTLEIQWPGGTRNRLDDVQAGERIVFPEIPCDYTAQWPKPGDFNACVAGALDDLSATGAVEPSQRGRFMASMVRAYQDAR